MKERHFNSFVTKLMTSVDEHIDDVHIFKELKEECVILLEEFRSKNHNGYDTLRSLIYFNIEVKQILNMILLKKKQKVTTQFLLLDLSPVYLSLKLIYSKRAFIIMAG